jgi:hypothetical protein
MKIKQAKIMFVRESFRIIKVEDLNALYLEN